MQSLNPFVGAGLIRIRSPPPLSPGDELAFPLPLLTSVLSKPPFSPSFHCRCATLLPSPPSFLTPNTLTPAAPRVVGYLANWAQYRPAPRAVLPQDLDPTLFTHLVYSFAVFGPDFELTTLEVRAFFHPARASQCVSREGGLVSVF
jgi:hypothetical protein